MSTSVIIDDTSPDIEYNGTWGIEGVAAEFNHTTHGTNAEGAQAIYHFNGSLIEVFGTIGFANQGNASFDAVSSYTIDGNANETVDFTGTMGTVILYRQLLFSSPVLEEGHHLLVVSYKVPGRNPLWLDYFRVTHSLSAPVPTTPSSSGLPTKAIVGIVVGGCASLALLVLIAFLLRRLLRGQQFEAPPAYSSNQGDLSWLQRLWARLQPKPPGELYPFDPLASASQASQASYSINTNNKVLYNPQSSISVPRSSDSSNHGMDPIYHRETPIHSIHGDRLDNKRSRF